MWKARAVQWQNAGINILTVAPKEGLISYVSGFAIPKNAPNKAGAYAFLDAALEPSAQEGFAVDMGYNPVVAQREGRARPARRASASRPKRRSCSSIRTSSSWPSGWRS